ncbi:hypothetical protein [Candidatus Mycolicibacterium alkanivorans]|uniref:Secreted protein n=1 Tax=Candidatus Mycolicibacterium alkanivorans TaxID=2954114 RepID=A0ABS9YVY7_9MYCO|nr:hypothetical protein [Candidatus Mycolicibacterium alkanivorans]MCI4675400.1 hypothetical protein [Candidatus Mycolicibacterium alkanivorans]
MNTPKRVTAVAAVTGVSAALALWSAAIAAADPYAGMTYADAARAIGGGGMTAVVASRSGSGLPQDQCIVARSQNSPLHDKPKVLLYLNCNAAVAGAGVAGNSAGSPEGQAAIEQQKGYEWKSTSEAGAQWCAENINAHPDWSASAFSGCPGVSG